MLIIPSLLVFDAYIIFFGKVHSLLEAESDGAEQKMRECFETLQVDTLTVS